MWESLEVWVIGRNYEWRFIHHQASGQLCLWPLLSKKAGLNQKSSQQILNLPRYFLYTNWSSKFMNFLGCFIYILDSSNSSSIKFLTSKFSSSCRSNWTGIWAGNSNGSRTDKQSSHFSTTKEILSFSCNNHNKQILLN